MTYLHWRNPVAKGGREETTVIPKLEWGGCQPSSRRDNKE
jgi:hypothetical protein